MKTYSLTPSLFLLVLSSCGRLDKENPIAAENQLRGQRLPGSTEAGDDYQPSAPEYRGACGSGGVNHWVEGFADKHSYYPGEEVKIAISVGAGQGHPPAPRNVRVELFRVGYYNGLGARLVDRRTLGNVSNNRGLCTGDPCKSLVDCSAWLTKSTGVYKKTIPASWTTGVYIAVLSTPAVHPVAYSYVLFIVKEPSYRAPIVVLVPTNTYAAYNEWTPNSPVGSRSVYTAPSPYSSGGGYPWPQGLSFYYHREDPILSTCPCGPQGACENAASPDYGAASRRYNELSFNRPNALGKCGAGKFFGTTSTWGGDEHNAIKFIETWRYDVAYYSDADLHGDSFLLKGRTGLIVLGHSEYWSQAMRDIAFAAQEHDVDLGFFGANQIYWEVQFPDAPANRRMSVDKTNWLVGRSGQFQLHNSLADPNMSAQPDYEIIGTWYIGGGGICGKDGEGYWILDSNLWVFDNTTLATGDIISGIIGGEWNSKRVNPQNSPNWVDDSRYTDAFNPTFDPTVAATMTDPPSGWGSSCSNPEYPETAGQIWANPRDRADMTVRESGGGARTFSASSLYWEKFMDPEDRNMSATHAAVQDISRNVIDGMLSIGFLERSKMTAGDITGDGIDDIVTMVDAGNAQTRFRVHKALSPLSFQRAETAWSSDEASWTWSISRPFAGRFRSGTGDDVAVVYAGSVREEIYMFTGTRSGILTYAGAWYSQQTSITPDFSASQVAAGDVTGDGLTDLVFLEDLGLQGNPPVPSSALWVFKNTGSGSFQKEQWWASTGSFSASSSNLLIGNVTSGDPYADAVVLYRCGTRCSELYVFNSTGTNFQSAGPYWWRSNSFAWEKAKPVAVADYVNSDGVGDLIVLFQNSSHIELFMYRSNGSSVFYSPTIAWSSPSEEDYSQITAGGSAMNGQGHIYLLRRESAGGRTRPEVLHRRVAGSSTTFVRGSLDVIYTP